MGSGAGMGGRSRSHLAPDQDPHRGFANGKLGLSGVRVSRRPTLASPQEPLKAERLVSTESATDVR